MKTDLPGVAEHVVCAIRIESISIDQTLAFFAPHRPHPRPHRTDGQRTKPYCTTPHCTKSYRTKSHRTEPYCTKSYSRELSSNQATPNASDQVPSACYRKGKRRENIDFTTGLRNNGEPHYLPGRRGGTSSKLNFTGWVILSIGYT